MEKRNVKMLYNLPQKIKFCKKCTISNQRPRISFDEFGICSACKYSEFKDTIDWQLREKELLDLLDKHRRSDGGYEVIVPCSGGKDSAYIAHELKHKYGMKVLTVTWAPHLYTEAGWENLQNMVHIGGIDNILCTPNGITHRKLTKLSFEILGDPFQPFIYGQTNYPMTIAVNYKVPLIMYGENGEVEYGGSMKNAFKPTRDWRSDHKVHYFSGIEPNEMTKYGLSNEDLSIYNAPTHEELEYNNTEIHFYGYYKKWIPQENYYYCVENTGFKPLTERNEGTYSKYASFDDKLDGFHYWLGFIKFGIGRCTSDTAHEIRDRHITREEGSKLVGLYDGEFPKKYFKEFLEYCDITEEYFWETVNSWRSDHIWKFVDGDWKLRHTVNFDGTDD